MSSGPRAVAGRVSFADVDQAARDSQELIGRKYAAASTTGNPGATGEATAWWLPQAHTQADSPGPSLGNGKNSTRKGRPRRLSSIAPFRSKHDGTDKKPMNGVLPRTLPPPPLPPKSILVKTRASSHPTTVETLSSIPENDLVAPGQKQFERKSGLAIKGSRLDSTDAVTSRTSSPSPNKPNGSPRPVPHIPALPDFTPDLSFLDFDPFPAGLPAALVSAAPPASQSQGPGSRLDPGASATSASKKAARREKRDSIACKKGAGSIAFALRPERTSSRSDLSAGRIPQSSVEGEVTPWSDIRPIPERVPSSPSISTSSSEEGSSDDTSSELFFNPRARTAADRADEACSAVDKRRISTAYILPDFNSPGFELDVRIQRASFVRLSRQPATTLGQAAERIASETRSAVYSSAATVAADLNNSSGNNAESVSAEHCIVSSSTVHIEETEDKSTSLHENIGKLATTATLTPHLAKPCVSDLPEIPEWQVVNQAEYTRLVQAGRHNHERKEHKHFEESMHLESLVGRAAALERMLMAGKRVGPPSTHSLNSLTLAAGIDLGRRTTTYETGRLTTAT